MCSVDAPPARPNGGLPDECIQRRRSRHRVNAFAQKEPMAGAPRLCAKRQRPDPRPLHVGPHVLRLVDPARLRRDVDHHEDVRGLLLLRHGLSHHRVGRGRRRVHAVHPARGARGAEVSDQLRAVPRLPRPHGHDAPRGHHALVVAGRHRLRDVLPGVGAPVPDADAPGADRPVRVGRPRLERSLVAALPHPAVRGRAARRHRSVSTLREVGLVRGQGPQCDPQEPEEAQVGAVGVLHRAGPDDTGRLHEDRLRPPLQSGPALRAGVAADATAVGASGLVAVLAEGETR